MQNYADFVIIDFYKLFCKNNGICEQLFWDRRVKIYSMTSKDRNLHFSLLGKLLNHEITAVVLRHCCRSVDWRIEILTLSKMCLLTFPRFDLVGFMSLHLGLVEKFGLWSFKVINAGFSGNCSMRLSKLRFFASCFASKLICVTIFPLNFRYLVVMLSMPIISHSF